MCRNSSRLIGVIEQSRSFSTAARSGLTVIQVNRSPWSTMLSKFGSLESSLGVRDLEL